MMKLLSFKLVIMLLLMYAVSCVPSKKLSYFTDINDLDGPEINPRMQKVIMPFDNFI
jgi:hypothetical protein